MLKGFGAILSPLVAGVVFAFLLNPLVKFVDTRLCPVLEKKKQKNPKARYSPQKLSRAAGIVFALVIAVLLVYAFFSMLLPQLYESVMGIVASAEDYYRSIETWANKLLQDNPEIQSYVEAALDEVYNFLRNWVSTSLLSDMQKLLSTLTTSVIAVVKSVANLLIGLVASIYMLWSKDLFRRRPKADRRRLPSLRRRPSVLSRPRDKQDLQRLCHRQDHRLRHHRHSVLLRHADPQAALSHSGGDGHRHHERHSLLRPHHRRGAVRILILLVNPLQCFYFVIFVICLQQLDGNVIGPKILGNTIGISGFWVLVSITVAAGLFGFAGMLLGVPVFAIIYLLISDAINLSLKKKGDTTRTDAYYSIEKVSDLQAPAQSAGTPEPDAQSPSAKP